MRGSTVTSRVAFSYPFSIDGNDEIHPAGSYSIETREKRYWTFPLNWEKRARTT
jgi:hypothetical protein